MKIIRLAIISFFFILLTTTLVEAQVNASFTANVTQGCAPMTISFINNSTGTGTLTYQWNFGNGNSSNLENPTANYVNPGTYTVTLIVSNGSQYDTLVKTDYIRIFQNPTANFTLNPASGCVPLAVNFTDNSVPGDTIITSYVWDFGDGGSINSQNPSHTYTQPGGYGVSLQITDGHGCYSTYTQQGAVLASSIPIVSFVADYTSNCIAPFTVQFTNQSSGMGTLSYLWNFGDGLTSTTQNPSHTYTQTGSYSVSLQVTNQYGCSNDTTYTNYININTINAAFHTDSGDSVCINQVVTFINDAGTTALWSFGDGGTSTLPNPTHTYTTSGSYSVMMIAAPGTPCQDTAYHTIYVRPAPNAQFSFTPSFSCGNAITFNPLNTNGNSYQWNFGDNTAPDSTISPSHNYSSNGTYYVSLILTDNHGCRGIYQNPTAVIVEKPVANMDATPNEGCKPLPVSFSDLSTCNTNYTHITNWSWDFGDGQTSNLQNPNHTYADTGVYNATLTITTDLGCTATTNIEIQVGEHQHPLVQYNITQGCANDTIQFISLSTDSNFIDQYSWSFVSDSGLVVGNSTEANPDIYFQGNGIISLTYVINHNGCYDTLRLDSIFVLHGPYVGDIDTIMVGCHDPYTIGAYVPFIKQANRWYWDMNDDGVFEDSTVFAQNVYSLGDTTWFTYPHRGQYNIHFIAYNDSTGCFWEENYLLKIMDIDAHLTIQNPSCPNGVFMNTANSIDFDNITFVYGDGTMHSLSYQDFLMDSLLYHQYVFHNYPTHSDTITAYIYLSNHIGCHDTDSTVFRVFYPSPGFYGGPLHFCTPYQISLNDTSHADTTIVSWNWTLNPGNLTSTNQNPVFNITTPGYYNVSLTISDALGCSATYGINNYIQADLLQGNFSCNDNTLCLGDSIHFMSSIPLANEYVWDYGDGSLLDTAINPYHLYHDTGKYTVTLYLSNSYPGCKDTVISHHYVQVQDINVNFSVLDADTNCYPFPVTIFNNTDTIFSPMTWYWTFGDGGMSLQQVPFHNYTVPGNFWLTLEATTSFGCKDKDSIMITVGGPYTEITLSDTVICKGATVDFNVSQSQNISIYNWDFGDGATSNGVPTSHTYNYYPSNGFFVPSLIYCSDATCCQSAFDTIRVHQVFADFTYVQDNGSSDSTACGNATLLFTNNSLGADSMYWTLGDGSSDTSQTPAGHYYQNTGNTTNTYYINLTVTSLIGCVDSIKKPFVLYPLPVIQVGNDVAVCRGSSVQLSASGGNSIVWQPIEGVDNPSSYFPNVSPDSTVTYTATIYDTYGCSNSQSVSVYVQQQPSLNNSSDTTIIIGEQVNMFANSDQASVTYQWSPATGLSCTDCSNPIAQPLQNTTYTVVVTDSMNCFQVTGTVYIEVKEEFSIDVPTAFTPNGDGNNDIIYVRGWGIKQLQEFKIFNRWGQCVFETDDLHQGWNGTFKGMKQDMDTYAYTVKALTFGNKILTKNGLINLLR